MSRHKDMQRAINQYRMVHNVNDVDMLEVARYAHEKLGMALPKPRDPLDRLAWEFRQAAREESRNDAKTGRPYRVNHMYFAPNGQRLWLDIDGEVPRPKMKKALTLRREQSIGDQYHMTCDADHWNSTHPDEEPIQMVLDYTADVNERKALDSLDETG